MSSGIRDVDFYVWQNFFIFLCSVFYFNIIIFLYTIILYFTHRDVADITDKIAGGKEGNKNKETDADRESNVNGAYVRHLIHFCLFFYYCDVAIHI